MRLRSLLPVGLAASVLLVACEDSSSDAPAPTAAPVATSQGEMSLQVSAASNQAMTAFQALFRQDSVDPANPMGSNGVALQQASANLRSAWNANQTDSRVAFGLAVTTLALRMNELAGTMERASENGLPVGGGVVATRTTPMDVQGQLIVAARTMATPAKAPLVRELQDSIEQRLLPVLDEAIELLTVSWSDEAFQFHVALDPVEFPGDTLIIDRSDVGFALSILQALRAEVRWIVSYNVDVDQNGSYAWVDTLGHIGDITVLTAAQEAALQHLESLLSNGSTFLKVRTGKETMLASVPVELRTALQRMRESAVLAYGLKAAGGKLIPTIMTTAVRDSFLRVVDTGIAWMSGPRRIEIYRKVACKDTSWYLNDYNGSSYQGGYSNTYQRTSILATFSLGCHSNRDYSRDNGYGYYHEDHTRSYLLSSRSQFAKIDLSKLLALKDLKVFVPRFQWNPTSQWRTEGPISFLSQADKPVTMRAFARTADSLGFEGIKSSLTWGDPTFGGVFPDHKTSTDVLEYYREAIEDDGSSATVAARGPLALF